MPKKYREVRERLRRAGWTRVRQSGSHEVWRHLETGRVVVVSGKDADDVPVGTLSSLRRTTGLRDLR